MKFFLLGVVLVHNHVVIVNQRATLEVTKSSVQLSKIVQVEPRHCIEARQRLNHRSHRKRDVWLLHQQRRNLIAHGSGAQPYRRRSRRSKPDISTYATCSLRGLVQSAMTDPDQRQDHRHLDGYSKHAQQRSYRPVTKIREDQFIEQDQILIEIRKGTN